MSADQKKSSNGVPCPKSSERNGAPVFGVIRPVLTVE
jgi:hypothetical protein